MEFPRCLASWGIKNGDHTYKSPNPQISNNSVRYGKILFLACRKKKKPKKTKTREDVAPVSRRGSVRRARGFGARGSGVNTALLPWYLVRRVTDSRPLGGCLRHPPGSEAGRALQTGLRPSQGTVRVRIRTSSLNYRNVQATVTQAATIGFSAAILRSF